MDTREIEILEKVCASGGMVDVNASNDPQILSAVKRLEARGYVKVYMDLRVHAVSPGRVALADFHQLMKEESKRQAQEAAKESRKNRFALLLSFLGIIGGLIAALIALPK